jgi:ABC-type polar amino acid transport system ATPase subunit
MVFQHFNLFPHLTALENCTLGLEQALKISRQEAEEKAKEQLTRVGLADKLHAYPDTLSGGQKQRVAIARSLVMEPQLMLFDEVTSALDPELIGGVLAEMKRLAQEGMTMIVVTHEMGFAREVGSRLVFLCEGQVVEEGPCDEVLTHPQEPRTRQFLSAILEH